MNREINPSMKSFLSALAAAVFATVPANASPERVIVAPNEIMILVPGLEFLGYSRTSTVEHCTAIVGTDYRALITDSDFEYMHDCLQEHT
jgi:hypothetical protein